MRMKILGLLLALLAIPLPSASAQEPGAPRQEEADQDAVPNVNARYTVESVEITTNDGEVAVRPADSREGGAGKGKDGDDDGSDPPKKGGRPTLTRIK